jgi:peptide/nickel transport system permease protein
VKLGTKKTPSAQDLPEREEPHVLDEAKADNRIARASEWQLVRWKFMRHKLAVVSLVVLCIMYLGVILAEFFSPYDPRKPQSTYLFTPPQTVHFVDKDGRFHLRPFVYGVKTVLDMTTLERKVVPDETRLYPLRFFLRGDPYKLWGTFPGDLHFIGVDKPGRLILLGTDRMGRDMLSLIIYGSRVSLSIGLLGVAMSLLIGITLGGLSGYIGGRTDTVIQRIIEFLRSIPHLPLWMALSAALPPNWTTLQTYFAIVVILSLIGWTGLARVVRGKFMAIKAEDFIMAAELDGARHLRIIFKYLLPSFMSYVIANITLAIPGMILGETSLSFIGLGLQTPAISWGVLLREAQAISVLATSPWLLIPGAFVIVTILAFNFVGDGLRDAADPYTKV